MHDDKWHHMAQNDIFGMCAGHSRNDTRVVAAIANLGCGGCSDRADVDSFFIGLEGATTHIDVAER